MGEASTRRIAAGAVMMATALIVVAAASTPTSAAETPSQPTVAVAMGDSYISGEAGRWEGNSSSSWGNRKGTDRAAYKRGWFWRYDERRVYGESAAGCHRSDVAPVQSADLPFDQVVNLACSGANTNDLRLSANGGTRHRGEAPQADQLAIVAADNDVELIVVSVGGNDLGFADIIIDCVLDYSSSPSWWQNQCRNEQQTNVDARMADAMAGLGAVVGDIRQVMAEAGQPAESYRLVLQTYPSPVPAGDEFRYAEWGWSRTFTGGCPFWNADADWANGSLVPRISDEIATVAAELGAEVLDLRDAFDGREVCASSSRQGSGDSAEWVRFVSTGILQGEVQESMHPNAVGQRAIGRCIALVAATDPGRHSCTNTPGSGPDAMALRTAVPAS